MEHQPPNVLVAPEPEPFPPSPRTVDLTPLEFILALLALVTIPALIYTLFFSLRCPTCNPFNRTTTTTSDIHQTPTPNKKEEEEQVLGLKYKKETHSTDIGSECPVCLSVFVDGEEVKKLGACTHSFHAECIDLWLRSHSSCPVCRASVKRSSSGGDRRRRPSARDGDEDFRQGLPDASTLV